MASSYIDEAIGKKLLACSTLTAYIGKRLYHEKAPQEAQLPHVVYFQVAPDNVPLTFGQGSSGEPLFQFECISDDKNNPSRSFLIAWEIIKELRHYQGTYDGVVIKYIEVRGPQPVTLDAKRKLISNVVEARVSYIEP